MFPNNKSSSSFPVLFTDDWTRLLDSNMAGRHSLRHRHTRERDGSWHLWVWPFIRPRAPRGWGKHGTAATREEDAVLGAGNGIHVHVYECVCAMYVCVYVCMYVCVYVDVWLSDTGMQPVVYFSRDCVCDIRFMTAVLLGRIRCPW